MDIKGPIKYAMEKNPNGLVTAIHISFTGIFRLLNTEKKKQVLEGYLAELTRNIEAEMNDQERQGMLLVQQLVEQLLPPILAGEIDLDETTVIEVEQEHSIYIKDISGNA
ncbi:MAG: hypothetical protein KAJ95_06690 [Gammaproteobacteria bacterium]|nr:hypothetical protein [Gammaproteobacteria bacterium]